MCITMDDGNERIFRNKIAEILLQRNISQSDLAEGVLHSGLSTSISIRALSGGAIDAIRIAWPQGVGATQTAYESYGRR